MKLLALTIFSFLSFSRPLLAIDQGSLNELKKQGFQVRMGELTGAGGKMSLTRLAGFIHPTGILMKEDCENIAVSRAGKNDPQISDVTKVTVDKSVISASEFEGFFTHE